MTTTNVTNNQQGGQGPGPPDHHPSPAMRKYGETVKTFAQVLGKGLAPNNDNNVLEVVLEKDSKGAFAVSDIDCCNLIRRLGLDQKPGVQVHGIQICPNGRGVIYITLKKEIDIGNYCRYNVLDVTSSGIRTVLVKPAGKREAVVTLKGIHPNTSDRTVIDYLSKFGSVVTNKVVYGVFTEGPLQVFKNGDRKYKMEIKPSTSIGSYHVLDGQRVSLRYPGQLQTCARCLQTAQLCKGKGVAKKCELWQKIGYSVEGETIDNLDDNLGKESVEETAVEFTPQKLVTSPEKFSGVVVKNIPRETDHGEIVEFLILSGLPENRKEDISIGLNGTVTITNLENRTCLDLIDTIHWKKCFGRKIYCNGYVPLTPEKRSMSPEVSTGTLATPGTPPAASEVSAGPLVTPGAPLAVSEDSTVSLIVPGAPPASLPESLGPISSKAAPSSVSLVTRNQPTATKSPGSLPDKFTPSIIDWSEESNENFVRRYSLSLTNRTPPKFSVAADILGAKQPDGHKSLAKNSLMDSLKDIQDVLTDFNSCYSTSNLESSSADDNSDLKKETNISPSRKKRKKKAKSALSRGDFLKKQDTKPSPK